MPIVRENRIRKEYYLNRITKASGVPKVTVRKVINALPEVVYGIMAECGAVQVFEGVQFEGVLKDDDKRTFHNPYTGKIEQSKNGGRPTKVDHLKIKELKAKGIYTAEQIAEMVGCSVSTVNREKLS